MTNTKLAVARTFCATSMHDATRWRFACLPQVLQWYKIKTEMLPISVVVDFEKDFRIRFRSFATPKPFKPTEMFRKKMSILRTLNSIVQDIKPSSRYCSVSTGSERLRG